MGNHHDIISRIDSQSLLFVHRGYEPREKPDERFYDAMRELSAIGNNINQRAIKANALGFVDSQMLKNEALRWHKFQAAIRCVYETALCCPHPLNRAVGGGVLAALSSGEYLGRYEARL